MHPAARWLLEYSHDSVCIGVRQWFEENAVDKAKMAVFAPIPIASVRMATIVKDGLLRRVRGHTKDLEAGFPRDSKASTDERPGG